MSNFCVIHGCPGSVRRKKRGEKIFFFKALEDQLSEWNRVIPAGNNEIKINDRICSRHFKDDDLIKDWNFVINDETVTMPRGRWTLRIGAVPEKFDNYEEDLPRERKGRKSRPTSLVDPAGSSSSDEDFDEPRRKRPKKWVQTPLKETKTYDLVAKTPETGSQSCSKPSEKTSKETNGKSADQEANWDKSCDEFVNQLTTMCSPTPAEILKAVPAKRGRGRPRKNAIKPVIKQIRGRGRPRKDQKSVWVSRAPTSPEHSTKLTLSSATLEVETENSVTIEQFVASASDKSYFESSDDPQCTSEPDAKPAQRGRGRPTTRKSPFMVSHSDSEGSATSDCVGVVEILNDPDSSSEFLTELSIPSQITIKTEKNDEGYGICNSASPKQIERLSVTSTSEDSVSRQGPENKWNDKGVVVKREMCECESSYSECCEPVKNGARILKLPTSPIRSLETDVAESQVDREGIVAVPRTAEEPSPHKHYSSDINAEPTQTSHSDCIEQESQRAPSESRVMPESLTDSTYHASLSEERFIRTPTPGIGFEDLTAPTEVAATNTQSLLQSPKNEQCVEGSSDIELDFQGFSSDEDQNLVLKRKVFEDSEGMAVKSTELYFRKLKARKTANNKPTVVHGESSPSTSHRDRHDRRSSVQIAINQLKDLGALDPARSTKSAKHKKQILVTNSASNIQDSLVQGGKFSNSDTLKERLGKDIRPDEVLKCGRLSDEVTVTKASNLSQRLDKVAPVSNPGWELEKVVPASMNSQFADKSSLKSHPLTQSSKGELILNKVASPSNCDLLKDKTVAKSSNHCQNGDKVTTSSKTQLFIDKVPIPLSRELFKDVGTSTTESDSRRDKIRSSYAGPVPDRLAHQLNGSSLDRILQSTKGISLLDSVSSTSMCDLNADKTSLILKNFKSDGVLALECVVYKEQVRQLQKELFRHKQMLIESEHNVSLLQRRLELQAELPCAKCVNLKRGFVGKETLI